MKKEIFIKELSEEELKDILNFVLNMFSLENNEDSQKLYVSLVNYVKTVRRNVETFKKNVSEIIELFSMCGYSNEDIIKIIGEEPSLLHANKNDVFWRLLVLGKVIDRKSGLSARKQAFIEKPQMLRTSQAVTYARIKYLESKRGKEFLRTDDVLTIRKITKITNNEFATSYGIEKEELLKMYPFNNKAQLDVVSWEENEDILNNIYNKGKRK